MYLVSFVGGTNYFIGGLTLSVVIRVFNFKSDFINNKLLWKILKYSLRFKYFFNR